MIKDPIGRWIILDPSAGPRGGVTGATAPKVNIFTRALLPLKFLPEHFSFSFQSSNAAKLFLDKGVELVG